jgi:formate-dependent nitrite reductase membrane component NrfD
MNDTIQYIHWINHEVAMGYLIACYLFFFCLAEGTHIVSHLSWLYYRQNNYRPLEKVGSFLPFVILSLVSLFLIYDLGHPERAFTMIYNWNWTAPVAYGFYVVLFCVITYAFHSFYLFRPEMAVKVRNGGSFVWLYKIILLGRTEEGSTEEIRNRHAHKERLWANASVTLSIIGLIYLGFFISSFKGRVAWNTAVTIFIFLSQGVSTGAAFLILFTKIKNAMSKLSGEAVADQEKYLAGLARLLKYALIVQTVVWAIYFLQLQFAGEGGHVAASMFFSGPRSGQFWIFQVIIGLIGPFLLLFHKNLRKLAVLRFVAATGTILGAFYATINIFIGGQLLPMTSHVWEKVSSEPDKIVFAVIMVVIILGIFLISYKLLPYENIQVEEA